MPQSFVNNLIHLTTSTKHRVPWIPKECWNALWAFQAGILKKWDCSPIIIGGVEDHIHALLNLSRNYPLKKVVEEFKKGSSKWMKIDGPQNKDFCWQNGYAAFSVSQSNVAVVKRYILNQESHHRQMTFQDELRILLERHHLEFDERFLWD